MLAVAVWLRRLTIAVAVSMSLFHLYVAWFGPPNAFTLRATHFGFAMALAYLALPMTAARRGKGPGFLDIGLMIAALAAASYPLVNQTYFNTRMAYVGPVSVMDQIFAVMMLVTILEATRRAIGFILPLFFARKVKSGLQRGDAEGSIKD